MDEHQINKAVGWAVCIIVGYHIVGIFIPMLTYAVIIIIVWRLVSLFLRNR